ncbi:MAG: hypothetical protein PHC50_02285 [Candidatus Cloacimonetes bacterium]|nr:hypothetical protein [Candidatus Cloacimonadota bacterium]
MKYKILLVITIITLTMISFNLSALILDRSEADSLVLQLLGNELADINVYAYKFPLSNATLFPLYRDLDTLSELSPKRWCKFQFFVYQVL